MAKKTESKKPGPFAGRGGHQMKAVLAALDKRVTVDDIEWPNEALIGGDEHCQGCESEIVAGEPIVAVNEIAYVHVRCIHDWFHGDNTGKARGYALRKK